MHPELFQDNVSAIGIVLFYLTQEKYVRTPEQYRAVPYYPWGFCSRNLYGYGKLEVQICSLLWHLPSKTNHSEGLCRLHKATSTHQKPDVAYFCSWASFWSLQRPWVDNRVFCRLQNISRPNWSWALVEFRRCKQALHRGGIYSAAMDAQTCHFWTHEYLEPAVYATFPIWMLYSVAWYSEAWHHSLLE